MPPRKRGKKADSESEEPSSEFDPNASESDPSADDGAGLSDDSEAAAGAKRKKPAAKKAPAPKKPAPKASPKAAGGTASPPSAKKPRKAKEFVPEAGDPWSYHKQEGEGVLIYRDFGSSQPSQRIAAFDLDGTLVNNKSGAQFPKSPDDWKLFNKTVPKKLRELHEEGYKIVIFTNQGGIKGALGGKMAANAKGRVQGLVKELGVPAQVFMAPQDDSFRKPSAGMWKFMAASCNGGVAPDLGRSFYCGDAAGRAADAATGVSADFSDSDKGFAAAVGVEFKVPEDVFGKMDGKRAVAPGAYAAAKDALATGEGPNAALFAALNAFGIACGEAAKTTGDNKYGFKAGAMRKALASLATFPAPITLDNLKPVQALQGVGKGTIEKIKEFLTTGSISGPVPGDPAAAAAAPPSARQEAAMAFL